MIYGNTGECNCHLRSSFNMRSIHSLLRALLIALAFQRGHFEEEAPPPPPPPPIKTPLEEYQGKCRGQFNLMEEGGSATFSSFDFGTGNGYSDNSSCLWSYMGQSDCLVEIICGAFDLRPGCKDRLEISDGIGGKLSICNSYAAFQRPYKATQGAKDLFIRFFQEDKSKPARVYGGFQCTVTCSPDYGDSAIVLPPKGLPRAPNKNCECGTLPKSNFRVVGGHNTTRVEFPWQAAIVFPNTRIPFCGGSILNSNHILTAAHCFFFSKIQPHQIQVLVGAHEMDSVDMSTMKPEDWTQYYESAKRLDEAEKSQRFWVTFMKNHKMFHLHSSFDYDVTLLRLVGEIDFVTPRPNRPTSICMPPLSELTRTYDDSIATVSGWGLSSEAGKGTEKILRKLDVPVIPSDTCQEVMREANVNITERMICAGYLEGGRDSCKADSGGPLAIKSNGKFQQIGIVSFGKGCARANRPGIYSRVTELLPWIYYNSNERASTWCR